MLFYPIMEERELPPHGVFYVDRFLGRPPSDPIEGPGIPTEGVGGLENVGSLLIDVL